MKRLSFLLTFALALVVLAGFTTTRGSEPVSSHATPPEVSKWAIDGSHSKIGFKVRHLGIAAVRGQFNEYDAALAFDPQDLTTIEANATIQVNSIDTGNERRDNHLRSPDFFAAEEHPAMTFVSTGVRNVDGTTFELVGDLTIRGTTKEVVLDGEFLGTAKMGDSERAGIVAEGTIDRFDYGLTWDRLTEAGGLVVGREVDIVLELEVIKESL